MLTRLRHVTELRGYRNPAALAPYRKEGLRPSAASCSEQWMGLRELDQMF